MNMEYWIGVVNVLNHVSFFIVVIGAFITAISLFEMYLPTAKIDRNELQALAAVAVVITVSSLLLWIFIPSADAIRAMYK